MYDDGRRWKKIEEDGRRWKKMEEDDGKKDEKSWKNEKVEKF